MSKLHQLNCAAKRRNTGVGGCPVDWKLIRGVIIYDNPRSFTAAELADLATTLQDDAWSPVKANRGYPVHRFVAPTDNTEDSVYETFPDGSKSKVRDGVYDWSFQFTYGAFCLLQALRTHQGNGSQYGIFYDKDKKFLGSLINGQFSTIPFMVLDVPAWKMNTGSNSAKYSLRFVFDANYVNEDAEYLQADFNPEQIKGLQDIRLIVNSFNQGTGVANVSVVTECGGSDLFPLYSTDLVLALWKASDKETGNVITISSVTPVPSNETFDVTMNVADPDFPDNGIIELTLDDVDALTTAGLIGYEAEVVEIQTISS